MNLVVARPVDPLSLSVAAEAARTGVAAVAITLAGVSKSYPARKGSGPVTALDGVDLEVAEGQVFGIVGPSGAGKSTLIRLVNGLERPSVGTIRLFGRDVTGLDEARWRRERRGIGMIFQHFNLLSSRTVFDNIALPLEILGTPRAAVAERVARLLELVGLEDKRNRYPSELSGGQKQRVGIARALATQPRILLCDEATSALDPDTTRAILALLRRINRELGVTILLITHEMTVIKEICDEVAVIEDGRIVERGAVFDVFTRPRHDTTRRFVEGLTRVETPPHVASRIVETAGEGALALLRIGFTGRHATSPVVSRLATTLGVDVNILAGRIDEIAGRPYGSLVVAVPGDAETVGAAIASLSTLELAVERLGYVEPEERRLPDRLETYGGAA